MTIVLDACVITKWFYEEEDTNKAEILLQELKERGLSISAPKILFFELGNIFLNEKPFDLQKIDEAIKKLSAIDFVFVDLDYDDLAEIIKIAKENQTSFYDISYYYLSKKLKCDFITADKKFYRKLKNKKRVKLL